MDSRVCGNDGEHGDQTRRRVVLEIDEAAEAKQITRREVYRRIKEYRLVAVDRRTIDGQRGKLVPEKALSDEERERWQKQRLAELVGSRQSAAKRSPLARG